MFNLDYFVEIWSSAFGRTAYSILAGTVGAVIMVAFLNMMVMPANSIKFLPLVIAFNTAVTGYMILEKTRTFFRHKWSVAIIAGIATTLLTLAALNIFFLQTTGQFLIRPIDLLTMLAIGIGSSWFGGVLAINYLNLN